jgi:hypothetical protein
MEGQLYLLAVTVMLLFALALAIPVLRDIVMEGLERHYDRKTSDIASEPDQSGRSNDDSATAEGYCPNCGAVNDDKYTFCQECAERL